jgi:hypothetical protein
MAGQDIAHGQLVVNQEHMRSWGGGHHRQRTNGCRILKHEFSFS